MNDQPRHTIYDTAADEPFWHDDDQTNAIKGIVSGVCLSIPIWILIGWGLWKVI